MLRKTLRQHQNVNISDKYVTEQCIERFYYGEQHYEYIIIMTIINIVLVGSLSNNNQNYAHDMCVQKSKCEALNQALRVKTRPSYQ